MKKIEKILFAISNVISIAVIYPFWLLIGYLREFMGLADFANMPAEEVDKILNRSASNFEVAFPLTIFILLFVTNAIIAVVIFMKFKKYKVYSGSLLFFGGLGIANVIFLISYLLKDKSFKSPIKMSKYVGVVALSVTPLISIYPIILAASNNTVDSATNVKTIVYSTKKDKVNLIEIFTDGFDHKAMNPLLQKDDAFNEFYAFPKYVTAGFLTNMSAPLIFGGPKYSLWQYRFDHHIKSHGITYGKIYSEAFMKSFVDHFKIDEKKFDKRYVINPIDLSVSDNYTKQISGQPKEIKKVLPDVEVVNWAQAKNDNAGLFGSSNLSVGNNIYKWSSEKITTNDNAKLGSRIMINDLMTHSPNNATNSGKYKVTGPENRYINAERQLSMYMNSLKNKKGKNGVSVFDNSLIIIYGDHADHSRRTFKNTDKDDLSIIANRSNMIIKYPSSSQSNPPSKPKHMTIINDRTIYAPHTNMIIQHALENPADGVNFIKNNVNFKVDRELLTFVGHHPEGFYSKFKTASSELLLDTAQVDKGTAPVSKLKHGWFIWRNDKTYLEDLFKKVEWKGVI